MPTVRDSSLRLALDNIVHFGDTDVLPFPAERQWFGADTDAVLLLLKNLDTNFDDYLADYPVQSVRSLASVGYNGFRAVTQIEPIWNAYLLALVIEVAADVESARMPTAKQVVFSYRFDPDMKNGALFANGIGWRSFQERSLDLARTTKFAMATDISDFYPRIYHHRLENALMQATSNKDAAKRIVIILSKISGGTSYGLPVGGNASRILAELLLNRVDRILATKSVRFCRFVDDYTLFADSREEIQRSLVILSESLLHNEGLTLARSKSRLMTSSEFVRASPIADPADSDSEEEAETRRFLKIRWSYDPYSASAAEDYDDLMEEVSQFDVVSMLAKEFSKTRVDEPLVKHLARSIRYLEPGAKERAVRSLVDNLDVLYPVFPTVAIVLKSLLAELSVVARTHVFTAIRGLFVAGSHITMVPTNAAYAARLLVDDPDDATEEVLIHLYRSSDDVLLRRDIIYIMYRRRCAFWLSDVLKRYATASLWEFRALLAASYALGDEGKFWRKQRSKELCEVDKAFGEWVGPMNSGSGGGWEVPL